MGAYLIFEGITAAWGHMSYDPRSLTGVLCGLQLLDCEC
jgi:hypothetical protein